MELFQKDRAIPVVPSSHPPPGAAVELGRQFDEHGRRILLYLARRTDLQSAEDILGETFVTALVRWESFDPDRQDPLPWLFGIASNLLRRHWRSQRRADRAMSRVAVSERLDDDSGERLDTERAVRTVVRELDRMRRRSARPCCCTPGRSSPTSRSRRPPASPSAPSAPD